MPFDLYFAYAFDFKKGWNTVVSCFVSFPLFVLEFLVIATSTIFTSDTYYKKFIKNNITLGLKSTKECLI